MSIMEMSISALFMIAVISSVRFLLKGRLPWSAYVFMWYTVLIRLLVPFRISSMFSVRTFINFLPDTHSKYTPPSLAASPNVENIIYSNQASIADRSVSVISIIWLTGMVVLLVYFLAVFIKYRHNFIRSEKINDKFAEQEISKLNLVRKVLLCKSGHAASPLTMGVLFPRIILPSDMDMDDKTALKYVIIHECVHIKRFDALTKLIMISALCLHWFNPFVWIMFSLLNKDLELSCDEAVIKITGKESKIDYAMTLIKLEEAKSRKTSLLFNYFGKNIAEERIVAIMKTKKTGIVSIAAAAIILMTNTAAFATSPAEISHFKNSSNTEERNIISEPLFMWPAAKCDTVTATFGKNPYNGTFHSEIDISGAEAAGSEVVAAADGTIIEAGYIATLGNYVVIDHGDGYKTSYAHCQELKVQADDEVNQGDVIATVGKTGMATGYHLGFKITLDDEPVDPMLYFAAN